MNQGIKDIVNYTLNMVGGSHGGPINQSDSGSWNKSFHGDQEIVAEQYQLCARELEQSDSGTRGQREGSMGSIGGLGARVLLASSAWCAWAPAVKIAIPNVVIKKMWLIFSWS